MRLRPLYIIATLALMTAALLPSNMQAARTGTNLPALPRDLTPITDPLVLRVQKVLQKIGLYRGPLDGLIGPQTLKAVRAYQKIRGLKPNNRITSDLAEQLETEDKVDALLNRLKNAKAESIEAARQALLTQKATQGLIKGVKEPEVADPTRDAAHCFLSPTPNCLLAEAAEASKAIFKPELRDWALGELLVAQAKLGLAGDAMHTVRRIADPRLIMVALRNIAQAQASEGRNEEAAYAAKIIPNIVRRAEAFAAISRIQATRSKGAATKNIAKLLLLTSSIADPLKRANLYGKSAVIQNRIGNKIGAKETLILAEKLALGLTETKQRETALGYIATAWAEIGDVNRAFSVLDDMGQQNERTPALISAATAQAKAGDSHLALETAQEIDSLRYKSVVLAKIAATQGALEKSSDALEILEQARNAAIDIKKPFAKDYAVSRIALTQSWVGYIRKQSDELSAAANFANTIKDKRLRAETLWTIAGQFRRLTGSDQTNQISTLAESATNKIKSQLSRAWMFSDLSLSYLSHGETATAWQTWRRGLKISKRIENAWGRTRALGKLATALITLEKSK
jgi:hypothetical protein